MNKNKKAGIELYICAFFTGLTGFLGAFYFIGCYGIAMFGEGRFYPYYMPFGKMMIIVCGISCFAIFIQWLKKLGEFSKRRLWVLTSVLYFFVGFVVSIFIYYLIDAMAGLAKKVFLL